MSTYFWDGFLIGAVIAFCFALSFSVCHIFWTLAQTDKFFTVLKEGYTKAVMSNGKPVRLVMRAENHRFRNQLENPSEEDPWDILPYTPPTATWSPPSKTKKWWGQIVKGLRSASGLYLFENLTWVGIPPTYAVHAYSFHWTSRVQDPNGDGMVQKPREETISHILAPQQEVYFAKIEDAKTKEMMPVDASVALTIQIVNPFKALFNTHQWLKTVINQIETEVREVIGRYTYEALTESENSASNELKTDKGFKRRCRAIAKEYGVKIVLAQFRSIEPTGKHAEEITKISLQVYTARQRVGVAEQEVRVAEQEAKKIDILADATERRLSKELGAVTKLGSDAVAIRKMELLPKGLLVLGGQSSVMPTIPLHPSSEETRKGA